MPAGRGTSRPAWVGTSSSSCWPGPITAADAGRVTAGLQRAVCGPATADGHQVDIRASFGVTLAGDGVHDAAQMLRRADHAMYGAKRQHDGHAHTYDRADEVREARRRDLRTDLDTVLAQGQIRVAFQPVVSLVTGALVGVEALTRWEHPTLGMVPPDEFIAIAETSGQIVPLGRQVLLEACRQLSLWQRTAPRSAHSVAVNLSVRELFEPGLYADFLEIVRTTGADPTRLVLEVTESDALRDEAVLLSSLHAVRRLGVRIAIDDFGSGYASVNHLRRLPVDILKLDRSLVQGALHSQADAEICRAIVSLASALQLTVVAEGVEHAEHAALVADLGCRLAQGYHYGRPGPAQNVDDVLMHAELHHIIPRPLSPDVMDVALPG